MTRLLGCFLIKHNNWLNISIYEVCAKQRISLVMFQGVIANLILGTVIVLSNQQCQKRKRVGT